MKTHGGKREGSGQKPKFNETTKTVAFRVPISKEKEFREFGNAQLEQYKISKN